ncbi:MAG: hypothetical protein IIV87_04405 [Oscillospiraceae bacterium]|nr:hypothetical protein [Oscillospiraceae bacterium]
MIGCYKNCDICVLRNGKAKKTDPPIPDDLAPISSRPRPSAKKPADTDEMMPELIYSDNKLLAEDKPIAAAAETDAAAKAKPHRRRGGRGGKKPSGEAQPQQQNKPQQPKPQPQEHAQAASNPQRKRRYRGRRGGGNHAPKAE